MLVIRLKRVGRKNQPSYRVIVSPKGAGGPKGQPVEYLGWLNPLKKTFELKKERIEYWISQGAKPSATIHNLLIKIGLIKGSKIAVHQPPPPKEEAVPVTEAKTETAAVEAPVKASVEEPKPEIVKEPISEPSKEPVAEEPSASEPVVETSPAETEASTDAQAS